MGKKDKKLTREQKQTLTDFILNVLTNIELTRLLEKVQTTVNDHIVVSKGDAEVILDNLAKVRDFILNLPVLEGENDTSEEDSG